MIQRTYLQALKVTDNVVVATDDKRIYDHVNTFGRAVMTSPDHVSGTDRIFEAVSKLPEKPDYIVNVQGDEPFIQESQINQLIDLLDGKTELATLAKVITDEQQISNPNVVKLVRDVNGYALYFSRFPIPFIRDQKDESVKFLKHIGMYAYRNDILEKITKLTPSSLEKSESLEQ